MKPLQFATMGTSMITGQFVEALTFVEGASFLGAYSRDPKRALAYTKEHGGVESWSSVDEMLSSENVDAVYVASPNSLHAEHVKDALLSGKHVLCEKPLAPYASEALELFNLAKERNLILMEGMRLVHDPNYHLIREKLISLGNIAGAHLHYCKHSARYDELKAGKTPNIFNPNYATGAMSDLGIYPIEAALYLFGEPRSVKGCSVLEIPHGTNLPIDVAGSALFDFDTFVCTISYSKVASDFSPCCIIGENGELFWDGVAEPKRVWDERNQELSLKPKQNPTEHEVGNMEFEVADFVEAVRTHKAPEEANRITYASIRLLEQLRNEANIQFGGQN